MKRKPKADPHSFVVYMRRSDGKQEHTFAAQRAACEAYLSADPARVALAWFEETASGKRNDRPELEKALALAAERGARLLVSKTDRLARSVLRIASILESGCEFIAADNPHSTKLTTQLLSVVAEFERDMIVQRTKDGLAAAKSKGATLGANGASRNLRRIGELGNDACARLARERAQELMPSIEAARADGHKGATAIARAIGAHPMKVWRALKYAEAVA